MDKPVIVAFDFDGTLTLKDSLFDFLRFSFGKKRLYLGIMQLSPILFMSRVRMVSNQSAKEKLFAYFFKGMPVEAFNKLCESYAFEIAKMVNPKAIKKLNWHQQEGHKIVIVSASIEDWIIPWAMQNNLNMVIATKVEVADGKITGKFKSKNCVGIEKTNRFLVEFPGRNEYQLYAYGDSIGDKELLSMADFKFFRNF